MRRRNDASQLLRQRKHPYIVPGERMTSAVSALPGTVGERILNEIRRTLANPQTRTVRRFAAWIETEDGTQRCSGSVTAQNGETFAMELVLGENRDGLFLEEAPGARHSLRHAETATGWKIVIGRDIDPDRTADIANKIVGWIVHGNFWENRVGDVCNHPYGDDPNRPVQFLFKIADGGKEKLTLRQFMEQGGIRSTHVGNWRPHTLVAAACGVPMVLHEFMEKSDRTATFRGKRISRGDTDAAWSPYTAMDASTVASNGFGADIARLARASASPFAFHLHATRLRFPRTTLESADLLAKLGPDLLERTVRTIAVKDTERFYRLIDGDGVTHRLSHAAGTELVFEDDITFPVAEIPENVMQTFRDLAHVQDDPGFELPRTKRLVPDTHFYVVVSAMAQAGGASTLHELSGGEMYRYLLQDGSSAAMHKIRNERLFRAVRDAFGADRFQLTVFPPIATGIRDDQYTLDLDSFDREAWLSATLET